MCILRCFWFSKAKSQISQLMLEFVIGSDDIWESVVDGDDMEGDAGWFSVLRGDLGETGAMQVDDEGD